MPNQNEQFDAQQAAEAAVDAEAIAAESAAAEAAAESVATEAATIEGAPGVQAPTEPPLPGEVQEQQVLSSAAVENAQAAQAQAAQQPAQQPAQQAAQPVDWQTGQPQSQPQQQWQQPQQQWQQPQGQPNQQWQQPNQQWQQPNQQWQQPNQQWQQPPTQWNQPGQQPQQSQQNTNQGPRFSGPMRQEGEPSILKLPWSQEVKDYQAAHPIENESPVVKWLARFGFFVMGAVGGFFGVMAVWLLSSAMNSTRKNEAFWIAWLGLAVNAFVMIGLGLSGGGTIPTSGGTSGGSGGGGNLFG